jgi:hypothetical protein
MALPTFTVNFARKVRASPSNPPITFDDPDRLRVALRSCHPDSARSWTEEGDPHFGWGIILIATPIRGIRGKEVDPMGAPHVLLAYLSPDTVLPLTSIAAAVVGGSMFLTRRSIRFVVRCLRRALTRPQRVAGVSEPHFNSRRIMRAEQTSE